jgi:hypothetical protein
MINLTKAITSNKSPAMKKYSDGKFIQKRSEAVIGGTRQFGALPRLPCLNDASSPKYPDTIPISDSTVPRTEIMACDLRMLIGAVSQ